MGKLSSVFTNIGHGITGKGRTSYFKTVTKHNRNKEKRGGYTGGYGAITFRNIMNAHCTIDDIINEFGLDKEDAEYGNCYEVAYKEEHNIAMLEMIINGDIFGGDVEEYIDYDEVERKAYDYAVELAESYINGEVWIPEEILDWAYYDVSDHNG